MLAHVQPDLREDHPGYGSVLVLQVVPQGPLHFRRTLGYGGLHRHPLIAFQVLLISLYRGTRRRSLALYGLHYPRVVDPPFATVVVGSSSGVSHFLWLNEGAGR